MKKNIDSNFAIAIILLVSACLGFAFWLYGFNFDNSINNTQLQDTAKKSEERKDLKNDQSQNLVKEIKYYFGLQERFTKQFDGPQLYLSVATKEEFSCSNFGIQHDVSTDENTIIVTLGEIVKQELCLTALGPATFSKNLNLKEGVYTIEFHQQDNVDMYSLELSADTVKIEPVKSTFIETQQALLKRTQKNLLRADCFYNSTWTSNPKDDHCERFFSEIETFAEPHIVAEQGRKPKNQFYFYNGNDDTLIKLIKKYDREGHYIKLSTSQGKNFICPFYCEKPGVAGYLGSEIEYIKEDVVDISACKGRSGCIMEVAFNNKDEKICDQLPEENHGQCLSQVGIAKLDAGLCAKAGKCFTCAESCYTHIALQNKSPDLCEEMSGRYRDNCYIEYADGTNNISLCDEVRSEGRIKWCLNRFE